MEYRCKIMFFAHIFQSQVLEQPNMQMNPGKHYAFSVGQLGWHIIAGIRKQFCLNNKFN